LQCRIEPSRKYYQLTDLGEQELADGRAQWHYVSNQVGQLLASSAQAHRQGADHG